MRYATADGFTVGALTVVESDGRGTILPVSASMIAPGSAAHLDLDIALDITALLAGHRRAKTLIIGGDRGPLGRHRPQPFVGMRRIAGSRLEELPAGHLVIQEFVGRRCRSAARAHLVGCQRLVMSRAEQFAASRTRSSPRAGASSPSGTASFYPHAART